MANETKQAGSGAVMDVYKLGRRYITLDVIFRALMGIAFVGMIVAASGMPKTDFGNPAAFPMFVGIIGLVLWISSIVNELVSFLKGRKQGRIYDITFQTAGMRPLTVWLRTAWVFGVMGGTIVGVWLVNFHIAIPAFVIIYLRFVGKLRWRSTILLGFVMELPIAFLYGAIIHTVWPTSVLERLFDFSLQAPFDYLLRDLPI
ncbi:MAG: hypothetical protein O2826_09910 [Chloroflexi bacterium]|nr:hypothetical protein [Chloroflexota bacterium]MDA1174818.1 hypothetical protein [Chloroflexota bacterium]